MAFGRRRASERIIMSVWMWVVRNWDAGSQFGRPSFSPRRATRKGASVAAALHVLLLANHDALGAGLAHNSRRPASARWRMFHRAYFPREHSHTFCGVICHCYAAATLRASPFSVRHPVGGSVQANFQNIGVRLIGLHSSKDG